MECPLPSEKYLAAILVAADLVHSIGREMIMFSWSLAWKLRISVPYSSVAGKEGFCTHDLSAFAFLEVADTVESLFLLEDEDEFNQLSSFISGL
jgi:hypothetical protein